MCLVRWTRFGDVPSTRERWYFRGLVRVVTHPRWVTALESGRG